MERQKKSRLVSRFGNSMHDVSSVQYEVHLLKHGVVTKKTGVSSTHIQLLRLVVLFLYVPSAGCLAFAQQSTTSKPNAANTNNNGCAGRHTEDRARHHFKSQVKTTPTNTTRKRHEGT